MSYRSISAVAAVVALLLPIGNEAGAQSAESPKHGSTVRVIVPASMGGSFGLYGQLVARHLGKHLPDQPNVIAQSMPGAGGLAALSYVYNAAPKDGSVVIVPHISVVLATILNPDVKFEADKFVYIGRMASAASVGMVHPRVGIKSVADARTKPHTYGATGVTNNTALAPMMFNRMAGANIRVVPGYPGLSDLFLAIERGEVDGLAATVVNPEYIEFVKKFKAGQPTELVPVFTTSPTRLPELPNVPSVSEFNASEADRRLYGVVTSDGTIGRSLALPPGVPAAIVASFRKAFDAMIRDPEFLAYTTERSIPFSPMGGEELGKAIADTVAAVPPSARADLVKTYKSVLASMRKSP
jgi:tripartite-type tricarboxylate transporter receptor subunit TctC